MKTFISIVLIVALLCAAVALVKLIFVALVVILAIICLGALLSAVTQ